MGSILSFISPFSYVFIIALAFIWGAFLFWRGGRRELVDNEILYDSILISIVSALAFGRLSHFLLHGELYHFIPFRILFFTTYKGVDFYGALAGIVVSVYFYLRSKKEKALFVFDLAAAPVAFSQFLFFLGLGLSAKGMLVNILGKGVRASYIYAIIFFFLFWIIIKLEKKKRFDGFFASCYLFGLSVFTIIVFLFGEKVVVYGVNEYYLILGIFLLLIGLIILYFSSKRNLWIDIKSLFVRLLLLVFSLKRTITSTDEAGKASRGILFSPYFLLRSLYFLAKEGLREISLSVIELYRSIVGRR